LTSIGSAYISLNAQDAINNLDEIIEVIHNEKALAGIHCCGNTDWGLLTKSKVDIINFDAYDFGEAISLYPGEINNFLGRNGTLAWGIVPTSVSLNKEDAGSLLARLESQIALLKKKGISEDKIKKQLLITPSCGTGTLSIDLAARALKTLSEVSDKIKTSWK
jgi:methionine synthase II (cobalamin-independent)